MDAMVSAVYFVRRTEQPLQTVVCGVFIFLQGAWVGKRE